MAKELYLYSAIYSNTAQDFISQLDQNKDSEIVLRVYCPGGDPVAIWGMACKIKEHPKDVRMKIDGKACSSAFYLLLYSKHTRALNVSQFLVHRAAYADNYELNYMTEDEKANLNQINNDLRAALEAKVPEKKFKSITGYSYDQLFDPTNRIDVRITAQQALEMGLINEVVDINDSKIAAEDKFIVSDSEIKQPEANQPANFNLHKMNKEELKSKHPDLYKEITETATAAEKDRVAAWMVYVDIDAEAVQKGIDGGKAPSVKEMAELSRKAFSKEALGNFEKKAPEATTTEEQPVEAKEKSTLEDSEKKLFAALGLKEVK